MVLRGRMVPRGQSLTEIVRFPLWNYHMTEISAMPKAWSINNEIRLIRSGRAGLEIYRRMRCIIHRFLGRRICELHRVILSPL